LNNKTTTVKSYLRTLALDKDVCTCVAMDIASAYASAVKAILPNATIVIDKFHVI
jgi:transposase